ncbi:di-N-acetylchitobiase-like isoform X2 [Varanus komodoensis]|nr:di-N-acetylchitobiase-like isoform X2 [Varanus komodoensis]XP_044288239.1 di-N-acetylchitobiase-like isoform X2 [Varanus komodoensis]XP_044288240.1 di-N-acetylchitobiase-like isoform X2 [Varanus komodoensis]
MDGINMDIEQGVKKASAKYYALTALVKETTEKFHKEIPGSQVTFDVAWSPRCINNRCYNYSGIADSCDFMFVMSYDEWPQMWKKCIVGANAPYDQTLSGYDKYIRMGINPKKLVMGVPWYGYDYTCLDLTAHVCSFAKFPFQMLLCSSAVRSQVPYKTIMNQGNSSLSGILWNKAQKAPYLEYKDSHGTYHQVWFDNPRSISLKAAYVKKHGLRGVGMWNANCLDYSGSAVAQEQSQAMWEALKPK